MFRMLPGEPSTELLLPVPQPQQSGLFDLKEFMRTAPVYPWGILIAVK